MTRESKFVLEGLDVEVSEEELSSLKEIIKETTRSLRKKIESETKLEEILRENVVPQRKDIEERIRPETFTEDEIIEKIFTFLGFSDLSPRTGGFGEVVEEEADYATRIESERILIESEPLNKNLEQKTAGLGQVKEWLITAPFEANYGIATNGFRWILLRYDEDSYNIERLADVDLKPVFLHQFEAITSKAKTLGAFSKSTKIKGRKKLVKLCKSFKKENLQKIVTQADKIIKTTQKEITEDFYEDYIRLVFGILEEEERKRTDRCLIKDGIRVPEKVPPSERDKKSRSFSVSLMNRLIFIKFLEDKGIVHPDLLMELKKEHKEGKSPKNFYYTYIKPLFYDIFNTKIKQREERAKTLEVFRTIPYLNGSLFRKTLDYEEEYQVSDSILYEIINLLEEYEFSTEGKPEALDPSILGKVFEKTINFIAGVKGRQEDLGAFYTPDHITSFCAEKTIRPVLLKKMKEALKDRGWQKAEVELITSLKELIESLPRNVKLADYLLDVMDEIKVLDPACGSGHFLISALGVISNIRRNIQRKKGEEFSVMQTKKRTVMNNIFGVDIVPEAIEITKLRLWLDIIAELEPEELEELKEEELALPNITFNIRQGNSLIGFSSPKKRRE